MRARSVFGDGSSVAAASDSVGGLADLVQTVVQPGVIVDLLSHQDGARRERDP